MSALQYPPHGRNQTGTSYYVCDNDPMLSQKVAASCSANECCNNPTIITGIVDDETIY